MRPSPNSFSGTMPKRHSGRAYLHRSAKRQPSGGFFRLGGVPGMAASLWPRVPSSGTRMEPMRPWE